MSSSHSVNWSLSSFRRTTAAEAGATGLSSKLSPQPFSGMLSTLLTGADSVMPVKLERPLRK